MGREIRRVPENWKHPVKGYAQEHDYVQLMDDYVGSLKYYKEEVDSFISHMKEIIKKGKTKIYDREFTDRNKLYEYLTEDGQINPPDINDYMPNGKWYQLFQNVGEGSPLSPPFKTKKELVDWLSNNKDYWGTQWSREGAADIVGTGFAMSGIMSGGKIYNPEEQYLLKKDSL